MADEVMNGNGHADDSLGARVGVQSQRIANIESQISNVTAAISSLATKVDERFTSMASSMAEKNKTQWPVIWSAIGVSFAVLAYFVTQNLTPLKESDARFEQAIVALTNTTNQGFQNIADKMISREEMDWRAARGTEDRTRTDAAIADLRAGTVTRNEWMERNQSRDHDIENIQEAQTREVANLQRQQDLIRSDFQTFANSLGNGRDFITDMKQEQNRLRDQIGELRAYIASMRQPSRLPALNGRE